MQNSTIVSVIKELLTKLGVPFEGVDESTLAGSTFFTAKTSDSPILIGTHGETLSAINHLVKKMLEGKISDDLHFVVDVNGYNAKRIKSLEAEARVVAERARTFRYDIEMSPMSAYDRMIIHSTLKEIPDIETGSVGEGKMRHIVVRYRDPASPKASASTPTAEV